MLRELRYNFLNVAKTEAPVSVGNVGERIPEKNSSRDRHIACKIKYHPEVYSDTREAGRSWYSTYTCNTAGVHTLTMPPFFALLSFFFLFFSSPYFFFLFHGKTQQRFARVITSPFLIARASIHVQFKCRERRMMSYVRCIQIDAYDAAKLYVCKMRTRRSRPTDSHRST